MPRKKLKRIQALPGLPHIVPAPEQYAGRWSSDYFHTRHQIAIVLELACGKGEYALALAAQDPTTALIGIDRKGERLWCAATDAAKQQLTNVAFIRADITDIEHFFSPQEVDEIWITFPDPFPKEKQAHKRLTAPDFLARYQHILKTGGVLHLLTDDPGLFEYSIDSATQEGWNVRNAVQDIEHHATAARVPLFPTTFAQRHRRAGKQIHYLRLHTSCRAGEN